MELLNDIIGTNNVITKVVRDEENKCSYYFYSSKKYIQSNFNDRFILIGTGPVLVKDNGQIIELSSFDFYNDHANKEIFSKIVKEQESHSFNEVIANIKLRKHINGDEFEFFMDHFNLEHHRLSMESDDLIYEKVVCSSPAGASIQTASASF
ncbi:hypothetical protein [Nonlabens sp. Asnod2-A12]|uniref:hypothetical protein n=1 Tax=Nonlabens sp. Asnod2-A12 TaxID=3160578 RepID=UPI00386C5DCB